MNFTLGLPNGSMQQPLCDLLSRVGLDIRPSGRNGQVAIDGLDLFSQAVYMRPQDIPLALLKGQIDCGICGFDCVVDRTRTRIPNRHPNSTPRGTEHQPGYPRLCPRYPVRTAGQPAVVAKCNSDDQFRISGDHPRPLFECGYRLLTRKHRNKGGNEAFRLWRGRHDNGHQFARKRPRNIR